MLLDRFYTVTDTLGMENTDLRPLSLCWIRKFKDFNRKYSVLTYLKLVSPHLFSLMLVLKECDE